MVCLRQGGTDRSARGLYISGVSAGSSDLIYAGSGPAFTVARREENDVCPLPKSRRASRRAPESRQCPPVSEQGAVQSHCPARRTPRHWVALSPGDARRLRGVSAASRRDWRGGRGGAGRRCLDLNVAAGGAGSACGAALRAVLCLFRSRSPPGSAMVVPARRVKTEYMKRFKEPKWESCGACYLELLRYRLSRRLLEQAHRPWLWDGWEQDSVGGSGSSTVGSPSPPGAGSPPPAQEEEAAEAGRAGPGRSGGMAGVAVAVCLPGKARPGQVRGRGWRRRPGPALVVPQCGRAAWGSACSE